jgi:hypothetical protein
MTRPAITAKRIASLATLAGHVRPRLDGRAGKTLYQLERPLKRDLAHAVKFIDQLQAWAADRKAAGSAKP